MQFTCEKRSIERAVRMVSSFSPKKAKPNIAYYLEYISLMIASDVLSIAGGDETITAVSDVKLQSCDQDLNYIYVLPKQLLTAIRNIKDPILTVDYSNRTLNIMGNNQNCYVPATEDPRYTDFRPELIENYTASSNSLTLPTVKLKNIFEQTAFCATQKDSPHKYTLGVHFSIYDDDTMEVASTNGHVMAQFADVIKTSADKPKFTMLIKVDNVNAILKSKILDNYNSATISTDIAHPSVLSISTADTRVIFKELPYNFFDYKTVLSIKPNTVLKINTADLLKNLKSIENLISEKATITQFKFLPDGINICPPHFFTGKNYYNVGIPSETTYTANLVGSPVAVNLRYYYICSILDSLVKHGHKEVNVVIQSDSAPVKILTDDLTYLICPCVQQ